MRDALEARGITIGDGKETILDRKADVQLLALPRFDPTRWFALRP